MFETPRHRKQAETFDSIDTLRHAQLNPRIDIPQIVICGDHTSDKDSPLEALTRLPFPKRSLDMQRCATKLVMRRATKTCVRASVRPGPLRMLADIIHLQEFKYTSQVISPIETLRLFRRANGHLDQLQSASGYWYNTLRIEVSGPSQSPLTLIVSPAVLYALFSHGIDFLQDLPAVYRAKTDDRSSEDVAAILKLAQSYLYKPQTIILAVVNEMWGSELQLIRDIHNSELAIYKRTLGVITQPEGILEKSDAVRMHRLPRNDDAELKLGLGWHVIKKPQPGHSLQQIGSQESAFFESGIWSTLPSADLGVSALRNKLAHILFTCVQHEMPRILIEPMDQLVKAHEHDGEPHA